MGIHVDGANAAPFFATPVSYAEAIRVQENLARRVNPHGRLPRGRIQTIAGADCSFGLREKYGVGGFTVHAYPSLELLDSAACRCEVPFPYIPGLLSFREIPLLLRAWEQLKIIPDAIICDGQGIAHPRGIGLASHLGVLLDIPTVGAAKSRLVGDYEEPGGEKGEWTPLMYGGQRVGAVLRTRTDTQPLFVSPGHRIGIRDAVGLVLECCTRFRTTEVVRSAHRIVGEVRRKGLSE